MKISEELQTLMNEGTNDSDSFSKALKESLNILGMSHRDLANECRLSVTTIGRWVEGKNRPVRAMRTPLLRYLAKKIEEKA